MAVGAGAEVPEEHEHLLGPGGSSTDSNGRRFIVDEFESASVSPSGVCLPYLLAGCKHPHSVGAAWRAFAGNTQQGPFAVHSIAIIIWLLPGHLEHRCIVSNVAQPH